MATWNKTKVNASDVNGGNQFNAGDGVRNTDINKIFESGLYSQDIVEHISIGTVTTSGSGGNASATITYDSTTGYPKLNLVLPRGEQGIQGESGSIDNLAELVYSGSTNGQNWITFTSTPSFTTKFHLVIFQTGEISASYIVEDNNPIQTSIRGDYGSDGMTFRYLTIGKTSTSIRAWVNVYRYDLSDGSLYYSSDYQESGTVKVYALNLG